MCCIYVALEQSGQLEPIFMDVAARTCTGVVLFQMLRCDVGERMDKCWWAIQRGVMYLRLLSELPSRVLFISPHLVNKMKRDDLTRFPSRIQAIQGRARRELLCGPH